MADQCAEPTSYRIVESNPPTLRDFLSDRAKGKRSSLDPTKAHLHDGLLVYSTLKQARRKALDLYPLLGTFVAELRIPADSAIASARTLKGSRGHHTLVGPPEDLLACVVAVVPVREDEA